ncbi:MAG TPA: hypothetical protein VGQ06_00725 [Gemmatimonadales bacterium]|jgi:hypothetical protein|nr:hypothetical protein [Gemmatimonadales bacterium]
MHKHMTAALAAVLVAAACSQEPTGVSSSELALAQDAQLIAQDVATTSGAAYEGWLQRLRDTLRTTDDPEAQACLAQARELRQQAREAYEAGDRELARELWRQSFLKVLCAVVEVFPNAPERTGLAVDEAIVRIEQFLGGRDTPRIRRILAHVKELRADADRALAAGDKVTALALNLRGLQILHRLVEHIRDGHRDHNEVADSEMQAVAY